DRSACGPLAPRHNRPAHVEKTTAKVPGGGATVDAGAQETEGGRPGGRGAGRVTAATVDPAEKQVTTGGDAMRKLAFTLLLFVGAALAWPDDVQARFRRTARA